MACRRCSISMLNCNNVLRIATIPRWMSPDISLLIACSRVCFVNLKYSSLTAWMCWRLRAHSTVLNTLSSVPNLFSPAANNSYINILKKKIVNVSLNQTMKQFNSNYPQRDSSIICTQQPVNAFHILYMPQHGFSDAWSLRVI